MIDKTKRELNERLDRIGIELVRASSLTRAEAEDAVSSPWLFKRLRARVAAESEQHEASERWSTVLTVIRHAVPAMGLATVVAFGSFLLAGSVSSQSPPQFRDQSMFVTSEAGVEGVVFADRRALSSDEVMETILNAERETAR